MTAKNPESLTRPVITATIVCILLTAALLPLAAQAAPSALPPRPTPPALPPRPTPPSPTSPSRSYTADFIELRFRTTPEEIWRVGHWQELWTAVQWQDILGNWRNVEGWQGTFDEFNHDKDSNMCEGNKVWWVVQADFGKSPLRWVVYQSQGGRLLAQSELFYLPGLTGEIVTIEVPFVP